MHALRSIHHKETHETAVPVDFASTNKTRRLAFKRSRNLYGRLSRHRRTFLLLVFCALLLLFFAGQRYRSATTQQSVYVNSIGTNGTTQYTNNTTANQTRANPSVTTITTRPYRQKQNITDNAAEPTTQNNNIHHSTSPPEQTARAPSPQPPQATAKNVATPKAEIQTTPTEPAGALRQAEDIQTPTHKARYRDYRGTVGQIDPDKPELLNNIDITRFIHRDEELLQKYKNMDFIYTFVNGSDLNHFYRKIMLHHCKYHILITEKEWANETTRLNTPNVMNQGNEIKAGQVQETRRQHIQDGHAQTESSEEISVFGEARWCTKLQRIKWWRTIRDITEKTVKEAKHTSNTRDLDLGELHYSIRSVEQHIRWHRGRLVIVSPGHHPQWIDPAKNFLSGLCAASKYASAARQNGAHMRLTTVHQDALMPYGLRLTVDSHVIEQNIWRVANTTPLHVYFNDDYFVNSDVAITDLVNHYGGTMIRTETGYLNSPIKGQYTPSWAAGVGHTTLFNVVELDVHDEDYLPADLLAMWEERGDVRVANHSAQSSLGVCPIPTPSLDRILWTAFKYHPPELPPSVTQSQLSKMKDKRSQWRKRWNLRRFVAHAPFVYCTNMFRYLSTRYEREFAANALEFRSRSSNDLFIPFVYNSFALARPWQASPHFLPYLIQLYRHRREAQRGAAGNASVKPLGEAPHLKVQLDNIDGCAPSTLLSGIGENHYMYGKFDNDYIANQRVIDRVHYNKPIFFNINAGCTSQNCSVQMRNFLQRLFPHPVYVERRTTREARDVGDVAEEDALHALFNDLMGLPVVLVSTFAEGMCPLVRSLQLALPEHRGDVLGVVQRRDGADSDTALDELRQGRQFRMQSAMPAVKCVFNSRVTVAARGAGTAGEDVSAIALEALQRSTVSHVVSIPQFCGHGYSRLRVRAFVVDAQTLGSLQSETLPLQSVLAMPGQSLSLEDFVPVRLEPDSSDVVLVLSRKDAEARAVHWITGGTTRDLLLTYPVPYAPYEDPDGKVEFV